MRQKRNTSAIIKNITNPRYASTEPRRDGAMMDGAAAALSGIKEPDVTLFNQIISEKIGNPEDWPMRVNSKIMAAKIGVGNVLVTIFQIQRALPSKEVPCADS